MRWQWAGGLTPKNFGGKGRWIFRLPTAARPTGSTTIVCPVRGHFVSTDVGKEIWVSGAGTAGVAFGGTIATYASNTTITASAHTSNKRHHCLGLLWPRRRRRDSGLLQCLEPGWNAMCHEHCHKLQRGAGYLVASAGLTSLLTPTYRAVASMVAHRSFRSTTATCSLCRRAREPQAGQPV